MYWKRIHAAWFVIHFFLLTAVCLAGTFWLVAEGSTILPSACNEYARKAELTATWCLGKEAGASNPIRRLIATYLHAAGIQAGYSFFAPNVPSHHRLTFELFHADGRVEYESPHVRDKAAALRLESLLDRLAEERYESVRELLVKMLAFSVWREHFEQPSGPLIHRASTSLSEAKRKYFSRCSASISVCAMLESSSASFLLP
jgi:hypothetical protein